MSNGNLLFGIMPSSLSANAWTRGGLVTSMTGVSCFCLMEQFTGIRGNWISRIDSVFYPVTGAPRAWGPAFTPTPSPVLKRILNENESKGVRRERRCKERVFALYPCAMKEPNPLPLKTRRARGFASPARNGFTLIELMLVVALMLVVVTLYWGPDRKSTRLNS